MNTQRLQAAFARKREAEHQRIKETSAVERYYDHWSKVTSKFANWTTPEYYKRAEDKIIKSKESKEKQAKLVQRRDELKALFAEENELMEKELAAIQKPKSKNWNPWTMEKINDNLKAERDLRRKLDLEAKLYGRLRHGVDDENLLYDAKSDNQVLAKLNWLEKQVENQQQREEDEKLAQERAVQLQEEIRKTEETQRDRQEFCQREVEELRSLQEIHMKELKEREEESELLKKEADYCMNSLEFLKTQLDNIAAVPLPSASETPMSHNMTKIKMTIRKRSEEFVKRLQSDIELLKKTAVVCAAEDILNPLIGKLKDNVAEECDGIENIENMYDSEAKYNLQQREELWRQLDTNRRTEVLESLRELYNQITNKYEQNYQRQNEILEVRKMHVDAIENSNDRLKLLTKEDSISVTKTPQVTKAPMPIDTCPKTASLKTVSDSFSNLNLRSESSIGEQPRPTSSLQSILGSGQGPRFGRKRVAWV